MHSFKFMTAMMLVLVFTLGFTACEGSSTASSDTETTTIDTHGEGTEFTSAYVCPMHCKGSGSDTAGECPVCGMDYVALSEHTDDDHKH